MNSSYEEKTLLFETPENILFNDSSVSVRLEVLSKLECFKIYSRQTINELYDQNRYGFLGKLYNFLTYFEEYIKYIRSISINHSSYADFISNTVRNFITRSLNYMKSDFINGKTTDLRIFVFVDDCTHYDVHFDHVNRRKALPYVYYEVISILLQDINLFKIDNSKITDNIDHKYVNKNYINFDSLFDIICDSIVVIPVNLIKKDNNSFLNNDSFNEFTVELMTNLISISEDCTMMILGTSDNKSFLDSISSKISFTQFNIKNNNIINLTKPFELVLSSDKILYYNELFKTVSYIDLFTKCFKASAPFEFFNKYFVRKKSEFQMLIEQEERNTTVMGDYESKFISQSYEW
jgi:hypothetical protein